MGSTTGRRHLHWQLRTFLFDSMGVYAEPQLGLEDLYCTTVEATELRKQFQSRIPSRCSLEKIRKAGW